MAKTRKDGLQSGANYTPITDGANAPGLSATEKLFLTLDEASSLSGLSQTYLKQLIKSGNLRAIVDQVEKIRRSDLERL